MYRFFAIQKEKDSLILSGEDIHRIFNVLRLKTNEEVEVIFENTSYFCFAKKHGESSLKINTSKELVENQYKIWFLLGCSKSDKIEFVLKRVTEITHANFLIFNSKRSVAILDEPSFNKKKQRYDKIIKEACEQSKKQEIGTVDFIKDIKKYNFDQFDTKLVAYENENPSNIITKELLKDSKNIIVLIGPEGGLDDSEISFFINKDFIPVSLGKSILRCETAPVYTAAIISYLKELE